MPMQTNLKRTEYLNSFCEMLKFCELFGKIEATYVFLQDVFDVYGARIQIWTDKNNVYILRVKL